MSLSEARTCVQEEARRLSHQWAKTVQAWHDERRWQFEHDFWKPLAAELNATLQAMDEVIKVIQLARQHVR